MRSWLSALVKGRVLEVALALGIGYATFALAEDIGQAVVEGIAQHVGEDSRLGGIYLLSGPESLTFRIGGTVVVYGPVLVAAIAVGLVAIAGVLVIRMRDRELGVCPYCAGRIPYESTTCAFCASTVEPGQQPS